MNAKRIASIATWVACSALMLFGRPLFGPATDYVWWGLFAVAAIIALLFWRIGNGWPANSRANREKP
jgi:hypothetical protein